MFSATSFASTSGFLTSLISRNTSKFDKDDNFIFVINELHVEKHQLDKVLKSITNKCEIHIVDRSYNIGPVMAVLQILDHIDDDENDRSESTEAERCKRQPAKEEKETSFFFPSFFYLFWKRRFV